MSEADRNDRPLDAGAASEREKEPPRAEDRRGESGNGSTGFYVLLSKSRADYAAPAIQSGANANPPPVWTSARITATERVSRRGAMDRNVLHPHGEAGGVRAARATGGGERGGESSTTD